MKLFYQQPKVNPKEVHDMVSKGFGIEKPEKINGYYGAFLFHVPDVYLSERVEKDLEQRKSMNDFLMGLLKRFQAGDYGFVTYDEWYENTEDRYIGFSNEWLIARYETEFSGIVFETFYNMSLFYYIDEDIDEIVNSQFELMCKKRKTTGVTVDRVRNNELRKVKRF